MPLNLIVCGFLGSGKTTLIRRIVREALADRRVVVVENESGRESVDGLYLRDGGLKVVDLRAGCVCCTLRGEMAATMECIRADFDPDCVFLEPSGLGDLADLLRIPGFEPDGVVMLVDVERFDLLLKFEPRPFSPTVPARTGHRPDPDGSLHARTHRCGTRRTGANQSPGVDRRGRRCL